MSSGTHETTWSGAVEETQGDCPWADFGFSVAIWLPNLSADADTSSSTINMDTPLPQSLRPSSQKVFNDRVVTSDGDEVNGSVTVGTDGSITVAADDGFSSTGTNGFPSQGISYNK